MAARDPANAARWAAGKCCTFQPFFPNFYLGAMLEAGVKLPLNSNCIATPIGIFAKREFRDGRNAIADRLRGAEHLCSAYDNGRCTVWRFRPGECGTYFCEGDLPKRSEQTYRIESAVAQMALVELGFSPESVGRLVEEMESGVAVNGAGFEGVYLRSWEFAQRLSKVEVESWLG
jgi:hypothetical protein